MRSSSMRRSATPNVSLPARFTVNDGARPFSRPGEDLSEWDHDLQCEDGYMPPQLVADDIACPLGARHFHGLLPAVDEPDFLNSEGAVRVALEIAIVDL